VDGGAEVAGVGHGVGGGLFDVGIAAGVDGFNAVLGVLEVGSGDDDGIDILARVELVVVADRVDGVAAELLDEGAPSSRRRLQISETATIWKFKSLACCWKAGRSPPFMRSPQPTMPTRTRSLAPRMAA
jgi:hypothetical protein